MFNIDFTFLWTLVNLLILFLFLKKFLFGRVGAFMEARTRRLDSEREAIEKERDEVKRMRVIYEEKLSSAGEEAAGILKAAKEKAELTSEGIIRETNEQAALMLNSVRARIESERAAALLAFKSEAAALVVRVSGQLLERGIDTEDRRRLARVLLEEAEREG